ncbi:Eukaryotic glutathione synthase ATP binding domain [Trypanosoma vivax]|nr:putative glutathione synthetase [Trypanosoma vivax]KAH8611536.1 Eukaryotic glutathione synthase ATP binding domain [Trypanosoma vivax]
MSLCPSLPAENVRYVEQLLAKCHALGLVIKGESSEAVTHIAVTLQPMRIPREEFTALAQLQTLWNEMVDNTARNFEFVRDALRDTAESDAGFTGKLVEMLEKVYLGDEPYQHLMLGIFRTDYMHDSRPCEGNEETCVSQWKNVEINTISCSFAGLSPVVTNFHSHVMAYLRLLQGASPWVKNNITNGNDYGYGKNISVADLTEDHTSMLEESISGRAVPEALAAAVQAWTYQQQFDSVRAHYQRKAMLTPSGTEGEMSNLFTSPVVLFVTQEFERNTADQYALSSELLETHGILSIFRTLRELHKTMQLCDNAITGQPPLALVDGRHPVAVVYFRSTYAPADFPTEEFWNTRLALERSSAIKCPSVPHHLLTFKKMQQLLCDVERVLIPVAFKGNKEKALQLRRHFMSQHSLNPNEVGAAKVEEIIQKVLERPEQFVLKPQREGGGNLLSGSRMVEALKVTKERDLNTYNKIRREYIVMSRICYPVQTGSILARGGVVQLEKNMCSEVGIFGTILSGSKGTCNKDSGSGEVLLNAFSGYTVRSKPANVDDGGVIAGVAALDSLLLV